MFTPPMIYLFPLFGSSTLCPFLFFPTLGVFTVRVKGRCLIEVSRRTMTDFGPTSVRLLVFSAV